MGSMMIPSHFRTSATFPVGRIWRSNGPMTVGPVTTRMAPNKIEIRIEIEDEVGRSGADGPGDQGADRNQGEHHPPDLPELLEPERQSPLEQDDRHTKGNKRKE